MNLIAELHEALLKGFSVSASSTPQILAALLMSTLFSLYIFVLYRLVTASTFYQRDLNVTLGVIGLIVTAIVLAMQSSLLVSMGMIGALSIVRFRTAVKSTKDLLFLFWAISIGIICGCMLYKLALISSLLITLLLLLLQFMPVARPPYLVVINAANPDMQNTIVTCISKYTARHCIKSTLISNDRLEMVVQVRIKDAQQLIAELSKLNTIDSVSLLNHDGELNI